MNLPNLLTLLRITTIPFFVTVLLTEKFPNREIWGIVIFLAASLTDLLDGWIARRRRQVTTMGIILDPIADKLLVSAAFISLVQMQLAPAWMVVIIIGREFAVSGLRNIASSEGFTIRASMLGKTKMIFQVAAVCLILAGARFGGVWSQLGRISLWMVLLVAIWSMVHYFYKFWGKITQHRQRRIRKRRIFRRRKKTPKEDLPGEKPLSRSAQGVPLSCPENPSRAD
ncbi:MAG: CDP-diacylglycerol--glycerol-3-phosphate 3-phosphatidyltransferase [Acidobacteria bacterium]|nr:CDP-diacylglycerol--glycerol-3-phosphate 3-phosphatidyltransferase [Acidobacteriota bacterium]